MIMLENNPTEILRDLEIRIASLEREAFFNLGLSQVKEKVVDFFSDLPYLREIKRFFQTIFKARSFRDAKREAKELISFGEKNREAQEYVEYVFKEERTLKGRLKLILSHVKDSESRPDLSRVAADTLGGAIWYMICAYGIFEAVKAVAIKLGILKYVIVIFGGGALLFTLAFLILFFTGAGDSLLFGVKSASEFKIAMRKKAELVFDYCVEQYPLTTDRAIYES